MTIVFCDNGYTPTPREKNPCRYCGKLIIRMTTHVKRFHSKSVRRY